MKWFDFFLAAALLLPLSLGEAVAHPIFTNEPSGSTPLSDWGFSSLPGPNGNWYDVYGAFSSIVTDNTAPVSPSQVYQQRFPNGLQGGYGGGGGIAFNFGGTYSSAFHGFYMKTDPNYENHGVLTKLAWFHTPNNNIFLGFVGPGTGPYRFRLNWQWGDGQPDNSHLGFVGSGYIDANRTFNPGQWVKVEWYYKPSSTPSSRDGKYYCWMDGVLVAGTDQLNTPAELFPSSLSHITIWGGMGGVKTRDSFLYFDHAYVSAGGAIGPVSPPPPPPPTTPPPPPPPAVASPGSVTDLTVSKIGSSSATLSFTQVNDGTDAAAKYDVRLSSSGLLWGGGIKVTQGTCSTPLAGTATSGTLTCTVLGLEPATAYQFQLVAYRGTLDQGAAYGGLSNTSSATTTTVVAALPNDVNRDGAITVTDVQIAINQAVGLAACTSADVNGDGACTVTDVQRVVNAALGL